MIIIGITLLGVQGKEIIKNKDLLVFLVVKMLVLPLVGYGLLYVLSVPEVMVHILILLMAMPIPANTIIYASLYKKNVSLASQTSVLTILVCIVTIPMVFFVISLLSSF